MAESQYNIGWLVASLAADRPAGVARLTATDQSIVAFVKTKLDLKSKQRTSAADLFRHYCFFCSDNGLIATSYVTFFKFLMNYLGIPCFKDNNVHKFKCAIKYFHWDLERAEDEEPADINLLSKIYTFLDKEIAEKYGIDPDNPDNQEEPEDGEKDED